MSKFKRRVCVSDEEKESEDDDDDDDECEFSAGILLGHFIMKQSYIIALIIMMVTHTRSCGLNCAL